MRQEKTKKPIPKHRKINYVTSMLKREYGIDVRRPNKTASKLITLNLLDKHLRSRFGVNSGIFNNSVQLLNPKIASSIKQNMHGNSSPP